MLLLHAGYDVLTLIDVQTLIIEIEITILSCEIMSLSEWSEASDCSDFSFYTEDKQTAIGRLDTPFAPIS